MADIKAAALDINAPLPSAAQLRMAILEEQRKEADKAGKKNGTESQELTKFKDSFLKDEVSDAEIALVRRLVMSAVKDGKYEALVYSFPSELCTDNGRAINSADPQWQKRSRARPNSF